MARQATFLDIPRVDRAPWGWLGLVLNLLPGVGSIVVGVGVRHRPTLIIGVLQLLSAIVLFGVLWSWAWGIGIFLRSIPAAARTTR